MTKHQKVYFDLNSLMVKLGIPHHGLDPKIHWFLDDRTWEILNDLVELTYLTRTSMEND